jgi:hypothetical protein
MFMCYCSIIEPFISIMVEILEFEPNICLFMLFKISIERKRGFILFFKYFCLSTLSMTNSAF